MNITITGTNGFAGTNLMQYLKDFDIQKLSLRYQTNQNIDLSQMDAVVILPEKPTI
jgi:nucleoside-diphosphate-sugar epimerase